MISANNINAVIASLVKRCHCERSAAISDVHDVTRSPRVLRSLAMTALLLSATKAWAFNPHQPFDVSADMIDFVDANELITAEGHVTVVQTSSTLTADFVQLDRLHKQLHARGNVIIRDKGGLMAGDILDYDMTTEQGTMQVAKGYNAPWLFQGASWEKKLDYYVGREASFTGCELPDAHFHFRARRVHLVPDQLFWSWGNTGFVDKVPVFYSPFIYKNLGEQRVVFQVQPGEDTVNGAFAKTTTTIRLTKSSYDRFLFDHYSIAGNGVGNEFDYQSPNAKGSLFGYYINPHGNPELAGAPAAPQYNIRSYQWQKLNATTQLQSNVNLRKNVSFNNQYFAQDTNQSVNDITSSIAMTQTRKRFSQRLVVERQDSPDPGDTSLFAETHVQSASLPRYEFSWIQAPIWSPKAPPKASTSTIVFTPPQRFGAIQLSANGTLGENYLREDDRNRTNFNGGVTLSESMNLSRSLSFTPTFTPSLTWQDKNNPVPPPPVGSTTTVIPLGLFRGFQSRLTTADTLRYRASSALTLDQTYTLAARLSPNNVDLDRSLADGGIETHHLSWLVFWRPSRTTLLRSFSGYDLRRLADEDPNTYRQRRFDAWTTELTFTPYRSKFDYFFRHETNFYPTRVTLWETDINYRGPFKTIFGTGILYNRGTPGVVTWNNSAGLYLSPGWRLDGVIHMLVPSNSVGQAQQGQIIDDELILVRDLHCWEAQFVYRFRPPFSHEYSILFNLKLGSRAVRNIEDKDLESQFYPWRAGAYSR
jgi:hypothetical protein